MNRFTLLLVLISSIAFGQSDPGANKVLKTQTDTVKSFDGLGAPSFPKGMTPTPLTTAQRDALTPVAGLLINNSDTNQLERWNGATWQPVGSAPSGPNYALAGFNGSGALANIPGWTWDPTNNGLVHGGTIASQGDTHFVVDQVGYTALTQSYSGFEIRDIIGEITNNYNGFSDNSTITQADQDIRSFSSGLNVSTINGNVYEFLAQPTIATANQNVTAFVDNTNVGNMPGLNTGYVTFNSGPNVATAGGTQVQGFTSFSSHPQVGYVFYDFSAWEDGSQVAHVGRNVNYNNEHPNFTTVDGNSTMIGLNEHIGTMSNSAASGININPLIDSAASNYQGISISPRVTEAALAAFDFTVVSVADVAGNSAGKGFTFGVPYSQGGQNYTPWFKVGGVGSAPGCCGTPIEVDVANDASAADKATALQAALVAFGAPLTTLVTFTDLGGSVQFVAANQGAANPINIQDSIGFFTYTYATHGAGDGNAIGLNINMSQAVNFPLTPGGNTRVQAISVNEGSFNLNTTSPMQTEANARPVNTMNTTFSAQASATIPSVDNFSFASLMQIALQHDAHITSGAFGLGSVASGGISLLGLDDSSTIADVAGDVQAFVPIGGTGAGGVVGMLHGFEFAGISGLVTGSPTLFTSAKAFEARAPFGPFTTGTAWGLYSGSGFGQNYMDGGLKIGSTNGDTTTFQIQASAPGDANIAVDGNSGALGASGIMFLDNGALSWRDGRGSGDGSINYEIYDWHGTAGTRFFIEAATGDTGIGTITPLSKLDIAGGAAVGSGYAGINAAPADGLIVQGNVGIGTASPGYPLEVAGEIVASDDISGGVGAATSRFHMSGSTNNRLNWGSEWLASTNSTGPLVFRDQTNARDQVVLTPGASAAASTSTFYSNVNVESILGILESGVTPTFHSTFQGGDQAADINYILPPAQGATNDVLTNDGIGGLSWAPPVAPTGTANTIAKFNGSGNLASSSVMFESGTFIGIGTGSPNAPLNVNSAADLTQAHFGNTASALGGAFVITGSDSQGVFAGGVSVLPGDSTPTAHSTDASYMDLNSGTINFFADSGLTPETTYVPTQRMEINSSGAVNIDDTGGNGGNVLHGYEQVQGANSGIPTCTATCNAGEKIVGGGCHGVDGLPLLNSYPFSDTVWQCEFALTAGNCVATAICAQY